MITAVILGPYVQRSGLSFHVTPSPSCYCVNNGKVSKHLVTFQFRVQEHVGISHRHVSNAQQQLKPNFEPSVLLTR